MTSTSAGKVRRAARAGSTAQSRGFPWFALAVATILLAGVALVAFASSTRSGPNSETGSVTIQGDPLTPHANTGTDPTIGLPMPVVAGTDLDGQPLQLAPSGQPQAIVFLAHWCPHCQAEVDEFTQFLQENDLPPLPVTAVSTRVQRGRSNYPPSEWLHSKNWPYPTLADSEQSAVAQHFGLAGTPYWILIDEHGIIVDRWSGLLDAPTLYVRLVTHAESFTQ